ncbi:FecR domain-containing protein [Mucilaginibacter sp. CAU 1740]|uniref:FecR domain-containing protein n=1 Tax=Mucilaginibacter sp. CAU 1740 TaxID=3140365 RepID=UPI00325B820E
MEDLEPELLKRYAQGRCTDAERLRVEQWLESDAPLSGSGTEKEEIKQKIWSGISQSAGGYKRKQLWPRRYIGIAAAAACVFLTAGLLLYMNTGLPANPTAAFTRYRVPKGKSASLQLADGSTVRLAGGSLLEFPAKFTGETRLVRLLSGQGFFNIAHDTSHPFILETAGTRIKVLGTRFDVNDNDPDLLLVTLTQGSISFSDAGTHNKKVLKPGEQLVYDKQASGIRSLTATDTTAVTDWTRGVLSFRKTQLRQVLVKLESYYGVRFDTHEPLQLNEPLTARFDNYPLDRVLQLIENSSRLKFTGNRNGNYIVTSN